MTPSPPLISKPLRPFLVSMILANVGSQMVFSLLPVYLTQLGASVADVGLTFSLASLVPLVLQVFGGWLSDSIGRLRTIAIGGIGGSLGYIGLVLAPSWEWALVAIGFEYISSALVGPSVGAYIAEQSTHETRGRVFGVMNAAYMVVGVAGPLLGGFAAGRYGFKVMLICGGGLYLIAAVLRTWMAITAKTREAAPKGIITLDSLRTKLGMMGGLLLSGGVLSWIFLTDGIRDVAVRLSTDLEPLYMTQIGGMTLEQLGWIRALGGLAMMLIAIPAGWMSDRRGERVTIAFSFVLQFAGLAIFVVAANFWGFVLAAVVFGLGVGVITPAYDSFLSKAVPESMRGIAFGLFQSSLGVISMPAPWIGGQLWSLFSPRLPFAINAVAALLATIPVWLKFKLPETQPVPAKTEPL